MTVQPGDPAPDFALPHNPGEPPVRLADLTADGNVVLLFFPLAFSPTCSQEMCMLRDDYDRFGELDAQVVGVSVDSPFALRAWAAEEKFPFPLLSDFNRQVSRDYDALYDEFFGMQGVSKRAAFVIDRGGIVHYAEVLENAGQLPDFESVKGTLKTLS